MTRQMQMIIGAVAVIVVVAVGLLFFMMNKSSSPQEASTIPTTDEATSSSMAKASLKSIMTAGREVTCEITYPENGGTGKIYVAGTKFHGEFTTPVNGQNTKSHMIYDGDYSYTWTGTQGMKFQLDPSALPSPTAAQQQSAVDLNKDVDTNCSNWSVDSAMFVPPTNVTFVDQTQMMKMMLDKSGQSGQSNPSTGSSMCDSIADATAKAACKSAGY